MTVDARTGTGAAAYRGFLFADMRGFTAFAERHGNAAAAAIVGRFLDIARTAIARHEGAEIGTEGDAIHAVFPSASSAVMCGLEIVDAAAELNAQEPGRPLGLGIGIHAGEAVETAEGYIGRAVNIAARLCSAAKAGEVLVSSTVKGITQASIPVGFIPRGRKRFKGIQDPILVYAVTRDTTARAPRALSRPVVLGGAGLVVALLALAGIAGFQLLGSPAASRTPAGTAPSAGPAVPTPLPVVVGALAVGTYRTQAFEPPLAFAIGDEGWSANRDVPELFGLVRDAPPTGSMEFVRIGEVVDVPCSEGEGGYGAPGPKGLFIQLDTIQHLAVSERRTTEVGGFPAVIVDITLDADVLAACGGLATDDLAIFGLGDCSVTPPECEVWRASPGERFRLVAIDVGGEVVAILLSAESQLLNDWQRMLEAGGRVLESVRF